MQKLKKLNGFSGIFVRTDLQKQPSRAALRKNFSENMQQIYWKTPMHTRAVHVCSPVNLLLFSEQLSLEHLWVAASGSYRYYRRNV